MRTASSPRGSRRRALQVALVGLLQAVVGGCALESFDTAEETDSVLTVRRPDFDFAAQATFAIDPEVKDLSDLVDDPIDLSDEFDARILERVVANLEALGWDQRAFPDTPGELPDADVVVVAGKVAANNWGYYGGCYPWFGYPYWWCYPAYRVVSYPTGSVILTMVDPDDVDDTGDVDLIPAVWSAGLGGLLEGSSSRTASRIDRNIDQAFAQSPYLNLGSPE